MHFPGRKLVSIILMVAFLAAPLHVAGGGPGMAMGDAEASMATGMGPDCDMGEDANACPDCINCISGVAVDIGGQPVIPQDLPVHQGFPEKPGYPAPQHRPPRHVFL